MKNILGLVQNEDSHNWKNPYFGKKKIRPRALSDLRN